MHSNDPMPKRPTAGARLLLWGVVLAGSLSAPQASVAEPPEWAQGEGGGLLVRVAGFDGSKSPSRHGDVGQGMVVAVRIRNTTGEVITLVLPYRLTVVVGRQDPIGGLAAIAGSRLSFGPDDLTVLRPSEEVERRFDVPLRLSGSVHIEVHLASRGKQVRVMGTGPTGELGVTGVEREDLWEGDITVPWEVTVGPPHEDDERPGHGAAWIEFRSLRGGTIKDPAERLSVLTRLGGGVRDERALGILLDVLRDTQSAAERALCRSFLFVGAMDAWGARALPVLLEPDPSGSSLAERETLLEAARLAAKGAIFAGGNAIDVHELYLLAVPPEVKARGRVVLDMLTRDDDPSLRERAAAALRESLGK